jgi:hypothetical protein
MNVIKQLLAFFTLTLLAATNAGTLPQAEQPTALSASTFHFHTFLSALIQGNEELAVLLLAQAHQLSDSELHALSLAADQLKRQLAQEKMPKLIASLEPDSLYALAATSAISVPFIAFLAGWTLRCAAWKEASVEATQQRAETAFNNVDPQNPPSDPSAYKNATFSENSAGGVFGSATANDLKNMQKVPLWDMHYFLRDGNSPHGKQYEKVCTQEQYHAMNAGKRLLAPSKYPCMNVGEWEIFWRKALGSTFAVAAVGAAALSVASYYYATKNGRRRLYQAFIKAVELCKKRKTLSAALTA